MEKITRQIPHIASLAYENGDSQKVNRFFREISTNLTVYSNTNYKLGLLFGSTNGVIEAFLLFKTALVEDPNKKKFWISYIDALISKENLNNARKTRLRFRWQVLLEKKLWRWDF